MAVDVYVRLADLAPPNRRDKRHRAAYRAVVEIDGEIVDQSVPLRLDEAQALAVEWSTKYRKGS